MATKKSLDILYQSDDTYAPYCGVSLESLLENNKDMNLYVHIMSDNISQINKGRLQKIVKNHGQNMRFIDGGDMVNKLTSLSVAPYRGESYAAFFKIFAYNDLKLKTDRLLYIDCDILVLKSIKDLCDANLGAHTLGMVEDFIGTWYKKVIKIPEEDTYYNTGIMLVDQKNWQKNKLTNKILNEYETTSKNYWLADQDVINICCRKDTKTLDMKYNIFSQFYDGVKFTKFIYGTRKGYYNNSYIESILASPTMVHCMSGWYGRPWMSKTSHPMKYKWNKYLSNTPFKEEAKVSNPNTNYDLGKKLSRLPLLHKILIAQTRFKKIRKVIEIYS